MDKNLDWKLLCFNIAKTTNTAFLLRYKKRRKRQPANIDNTWGVVTLSQTFCDCSFVKIFKSKMIKNMQKRVLYLIVHTIVPVLKRVSIQSRISIRSASHSDVS